VQLYDSLRRRDVPFESGEEWDNELFVGVALTLPVSSHPCPWHDLILMVALQAATVCIPIPGKGPVTERYTEFGRPLQRTRSCRC
jgi:hypothetical protein